MLLSLILCFHFRITVLRIEDADVVRKSDYKTRILTNQWPEPENPTEFQRPTGRHSVYSIGRKLYERGNDKKPVTDASLKNFLQEKPADFNEVILYVPPIHNEIGSKPKQRFYVSLKIYFVHLF